MTTIHGFTLTRETDIPELNVHVRVFRHDKTGAQLISMENDDENKVFGITFRTPRACHPVEYRIDMYVNGAFTTTTTAPPRSNTSPAAARERGRGSSTVCGPSLLTDTGGGGGRRRYGQPLTAEK